MSDLACKNLVRKNDADFKTATLGCPGPVVAYRYQPLKPGACDEPVSFLGGTR